MSYYQDNIERFKAYRKKKASERKSDEEVSNYLKDAMPGVYAAIEKSVKQNREPYNESKKARASYLYKSYQQYDDKNGYTNNLTRTWILTHLLNKKCFYCGCSDYTALGADRIDSGKGHTTSNVVPCCLGCNGRKHNLTIDEYFKLCRKWGYFGLIGELWRRFQLFLKNLTELLK